MSDTLLAAIFGAIAVIGAAWIKARFDKVQGELTDYKLHEKQNRTDLILLGENMSAVRSDNAKLALLVNQLFNQYETALGRKPDIDIEMIKHMQTIQYITGPLGPLDVNQK